ncbi:CCR4-NOT core subunit CAF130 [Saccharomyces eubayanus]|uniref:CCR4-NOT core subunit CAF130 n=1 Tax=Saccharomyces eubayanus TaxID=1080349 RepID=UPI0006C07641|nr:CAF130-like protein [Saccharomyces eubayanus]KOG99624.1 CAF130-like protein [Saccharomyces eubayanus]
MMNKKKSASNDVEKQTLASGVDDPLGDAHHYAQFVSLQELLKDKHYTPSVENLEKLLYDETILNDQEIRFPLLFEALSVTLFTTKAGKSALQMMKASTLKERKAWEKSFENHDSNYASIILSWKKDDVLFLKFLKFILANKTTPLQIDRYNLPKYKLPLSFLIVSKVNLPSIILNEKYNMLKDYLYAISGRIEGFITCNSTFDQSARIFKRTLQEYDRMIEFRNFFWYSFNAEKTITSKLNNNINLLMDSHEDNPDGTGIVDDTGKSNNHQKQPKDTIIHRTVNDQEQIYSFELNQDGTLQIPNVMEHSLLRHELLFKILNLTPVMTPLLEQQFTTLCGLVDPLTQPTPNDKHVISIDFLYQLFLGLMYPSIETSQEHNNHYDWKFYTCFNMQKIIDATMLRLNCFGFEKLNSINNTDDTVHWRTQLHIWLPHGLNTQDLELLYMIDILAVYTIYKLYEEVPIQLNPFLFSLLSLWKNLSCVILLALEIDRIEEEKGTYETPLMVRATIRGAAALRSVIATVLNGLVKSNDHDFKHESLNTFMSPYGRKLCHGALYADLRSHTASLLALGANIEDVTDLFADLQSGDRFDEDIRYMFDYECEDYNESFSDSGDEELEEGVNSGEKAKTSIHNGFYQRRCNCIFNDDKLVAEDGANGAFASTNNDSMKDEMRSDGNAGSNTAATNANHATSSINPFSVRSRSTFEFDYSGEDWRDVPKDFNLYYSPSYSFIQEPKLDIIFNLTLRGATEKLSREESVLLIRSVASCVRNEQDQMILADLGSNFTSIGENIQSGDTGITSDKTNDEELRRTTPDDIYEIWSEESAFERMLYVNHDVAWRLMDEMLMCTGYRRILIWFLTHLELKHSLIYYVFELIMGLRGSPFSGEASDQDRKDDMIYEILKKKQKNENTSGLPFSRQGPIVLSDIETKMLLQEFFMNAAIFLSSKNTEEESEDGDKVSLYSLGLVKLICYMVQTLIANDKFFFTKSECTFELQTLLMTWIGILPEAKDLFFQIKSRLAMEEDDNADVTVQHKDKKDLDSKKSNTKSISTLNMKILSLFPSNLTDKDDNSAISTLRSFITDYSFDTQVVAPGRRVVFHDDKILPLPKADKPIPLHEYITLAELDMGDSE